MRKIIHFSLLLVVMNLFFNEASAQLPKALAFGNFTYANPANAELKNVSNYGIGYEIGGGIGFGKTILMASIGSMRYNVTQKAVGGVTYFADDHFNVTPIKVGLRRYLLLGLFLNGNLGLAVNESKSNFLYEAGAGYKLGFFEVGAAYTGYKLNNGITANSFLFKGGLAIKL